MKLNNVAEIINEQISMQDVLSKYHHLGKKNRCNCPIHNGKDNNFCYTDKVFHCWTCSAKGNVISFVMQLFGISFKQAVLRIDLDFGLNLPLSKSKNKSKQAEINEKVAKIRKERETVEQNRAKKEQEYDDLISEYAKCELIIRELKPKSPSDELLDIYAEAMHRMPILKYRLDYFE